MRATQDYWSTGEADDLEVDPVTSAALATLVEELGDPDSVEEWPDWFERIRMVEVDEGYLVVALHVVEAAGRDHVLTSALFVPYRGAPRLLGSSLERILNPDA